jgi:hypothetical protein
MATLQGVAHSQNVLVNSSFENTQLNASPYNSPYNSSTNPSGYTDDYQTGVIRSYLETADGMGWQTTSTDNKIEIWRNGQTNRPGVEAPLGEQWAEINATENATLFQDVTISTSGLVDLGFYHRGRIGSDTLNVTVTYLGLDNVIGGGDDSQVFSRDYSTDNTAWVLYNEQDQFTSIANGKYRFAYAAVSTSSGDATVGNFIDNPFFGVAAAIPEPSAALLGLLSSCLLLRRRR